MLPPAKRRLARADILDHWREELMKRYPHLPLFALLLFVMSVPLLAAPRYVERYSTDNGRDLERVSVTGEIISISGQKAKLLTEDGQHVTVNLGPRRYWEQRGYSIHSGVEVTVGGWGEIYDGDGGYVFAGSIDGPGFYFEMCDSDGYPRWADRDGYRDGWCPSFDWADRCYCDDYDRYIYRDVYYAPPPPRVHVSLGWCWGVPRHNVYWWHHDNHRRHHDDWRHDDRGGHHDRGRHDDRGGNRGHNGDHEKDRRGRR
jgi:hypothetical protein